MLPCCDPDDHAPSGFHRNSRHITKRLSAETTKRVRNEIAHETYANGGGGMWWGKFQRDGGQSFSLVLAGKRQSRASLDIQVVDVNDNPPVFVGAPAILSLREDIPEGSVITKIRTSDPDTGVGGLVRFSINDDELFAVEKQKCSGGECWTTMKLKKQLDFEKLAFTF